MKKIMLTALTVLSLVIGGVGLAACGGFVAIPSTHAWMDVPVVGGEGQGE